jgi:putative ABC transport system substrate-binding protein
MPVAANFAVLVNPTSPNTDAVIKAVRAAAYVISRDVEIIKASTNREIDDAFSSLTKKHVNALVVTTNTLFIARRVQLVGLAAHHRLPAIYGDRSYTEIGGLASYGTNGLEQSRQAGIYVGRILKQEKPSDLPVLQPTKFELVINLQTARTLGIVVPASLHAIADEVIE